MLTALRFHGRPLITGGELRGEGVEPRDEKRASVTTLVGSAREPGNA